MEPDWAHLLPELVSIISKKILIIKEYVNLRAVCKPWRETLTPRPLHLPHQVPWLMLPRGSPDDFRKNGIDDSYITFYDLSRSTIHRFELPFLSGKYICGSSHGWLILEHDYRLSLLNPITRTSIKLPSFSDVSTNLVIGYKRKRSDSFDEKRRYKRCIRKVILSSNPSEPGCVVVARFKSLGSLLYYCRIGDSSWTKLRADVGQNPALSPMWDFIFQNNLVFTMNFKGEVTIYDLENLSVKTFPSRLMLNNACYNLVQGVGEFGGPLIVKHSVDSEKTSFSVYEWVNNGEPKWCQVKNIGKQVLFINLFKSLPVLSSANLQLENWQGNQICYHAWRPMTSEYFQIDINCVNLESRKDVENIHSPTDEFPRKSGATLWLTPSLI
ncbi:F-box family protein [Rhynchospora pubera]|uniref:F-box family protein n=1 Tax=Rhynchospora pubera TaxID=906938 RepID=A0AAV8AGQ2_9POAL|nr:F-box family protein [Rhynchospora pubera]KAJ4733046.1 F-box family protein [Rhynchospora pubera]KAJ4753890.1 F-box family protein [Rhynchospora pubera]